MTNSIIHKSELEDFTASIMSAGLVATDFKIIEYPVENSTDNEYAVVGKIKVTRTSTNRTKIYSAGHGSLWPAQFADDLRHGEYGRA